MKKLSIILVSSLLFMSACGGEAPRQETPAPAKVETKAEQAVAVEPPPPLEAEMPEEKAAEETPVKAAEETPVKAAEETPVKAAEETPVKVAEETPVKVAKPKALKKCTACHSFEAAGKKKVGPNLFGIYGAEAGKVSGYKYSSGFMKAYKGKKWDDPTLDAWIKDSKALAKGTKMFIKVSKPGDRAKIIEYMKTVK